MNPDDARIAGYYDALVERFGHAPQAADASSAASLEARYRVLSEVIDLRERSVLDVGCGFGGFGGYLRERSPQARYSGVDVSPRMIAEGRLAFPGLALSQGALLELPATPLHDVVVAQGIFYLLQHEPEQATQRLIARMFELCRHAVAFCGLSAWAPEPAAGEHHLDPLEVLAYCRTLTPRVVLRHDYLPHDVCFYLYRP